MSETKKAGQRRPTSETIDNNVRMEIGGQVRSWSSWFMVYDKTLPS